MYPNNVTPVIFPNTVLCHYRDRIFCSLKWLVFDITNLKILMLLNACLAQPKLLDSCRPRPDNTVNFLDPVAPSVSSLLLTTIVPL